MFYLHLNTNSNTCETCFAQLLASAIPTNKKRLLYAVASLLVETAGLRTKARRVAAYHDKTRLVLIKLESGCGVLRRFSPMLLTNKKRLLCAVAFYWWKQQGSEQRLTASGSPRQNALRSAKKEKEGVAFCAGSHHCS